MPLAQNNFKTITKVIPTSPTEVYTAPIGYSSVILLAQAANIGTDVHTVSMSHKRTSGGVTVVTEIVKDLPIDPKDTASLLIGKLVLEQSDKLVISANDSTNLKFIASILETLN